jgi:hypothetical protein
MTRRAITRPATRTSSAFSASASSPAGRPAYASCSSAASAVRSNEYAKGSFPASRSALALSARSVRISSTVLPASGLKFFFALCARCFSPVSPFGCSAGFSAGLQSQLAEALTCCHARSWSCGKTVVQQLGLGKSRQCYLAPDPTKKHLRGVFSGASAISEASHLVPRAPVLSLGKLGCAEMVASNRTGVRWTHHTSTGNNAEDATT